MCSSIANGRYLPTSHAYYSNSNTLRPRPMASTRSTDFDDAECGPRRTARDDAILRSLQTDRRLEMGSSRVVALCWRSKPSQTLTSITADSREQVDEVPSAILLEQAAISDLHLPRVSRRKYAFHMTMAATRFEKCGLVGLQCLEKSQLFAG